MATITSNATGDWGTGGTWVGGVVPADNDTVVIASGHVVTFNVDQSGFANGIAGMTITGTLKLSRTASGYLKMKTATFITGAGTFDCGASGDAIPFAVKHTVTGGAGWYITGAAGLTMTVYAAEPTNKYILTSGIEAIGQTEIGVDTDVSGDIWAVGDTIHINDINQAKESEARVIAAAGIASDHIDITAGLTAAKAAGAIVTLITRNVRFVGAGAHLLQAFTSGKLTIAGGEFTVPAHRIISLSYGATISGGTFYAPINYCMYGGNSNTISGGVWSGNPSGYSVFGTSIGISISGGLFTGCGSICYQSTGITILGGLFIGNDNCFSQCIGMNVFGGTFSNNTDGILNSSAIIKNAIFTANTRDINASIVTCFNTLLASTENINYATLAKEIYSESIDHDQVAGGFKAWTKGGVTASDAVTVPSGYTSSNIITLADASNEGFWQKEVTVGAGASVNITMNLYKSGAMTYLPRCIIFNKAETDPFAGGVGIHTFTMTDSTTTWEDELYTYTNATANDVTLVIRFQGKNASGTVATALLVEQINVDLTAAIALLNTIATDTTTDIPALIAAIPTAVENRQEMDSNSTRLSTIATDTTTNIPALIAALDTNSVLSEAVEGTITVQQALKILLAELAGIVTGGGTTTITYRNPGDDKDRVILTVDEKGNRTEVITDLT